MTLDTTLEGVQILVFILRGQLVVGAGKEEKRTRQRVLPNMPDELPIPADLERPAGP